MSEPIIQDLWGNTVHQFHEEARTSDPFTSHQAAKPNFRRASQRHRLLECYGEMALLVDDGLTDEEAAMLAGIAKGCPWKRCSELREAGLIAATEVTRKSEAGAEQRVCRITQNGEAVLAELSQEEPHD